MYKCSILSLREDHALLQVEGDGPPGDPSLTVLPEDMSSPTPHKDAKLYEEILRSAALV